MSPSFGLCRAAMAMAIGFKFFLLASGGMVGALLAMEESLNNPRLRLFHLTWKLLRRPVSCQIRALPHKIQRGQVWIWCFRPPPFPIHRATTSTFTHPVTTTPNAPAIHPNRRCSRGRIRVSANLPRRSWGVLCHHPSHQALLAPPW